MERTWRWFGKKDKITLAQLKQHHGRGDGLPCLLNDEHLSVLFDAHLLQEHVHDDERHQWKKQWIM